MELKASLAHPVNRCVEQVPFQRGGKEEVGMWREDCIGLRENSCVSADDLEGQGWQALRQGFLV